VKFSQRRHGRGLSPLRGLGPFVSCTDRQLDLLTPELTEITVEPGVVCARRGRLISGAYVIAAGDVDVALDATVRRAGPGSVLGPRPGASELLWDYSAVTASEATLVEMTVSGFNAALHIVPGLASLMADGPISWTPHDIDLREASAGERSPAATSQTPRASARLTARTVGLDQQLGL
jgi:CRP-like cAMP-binding protein